MELVIVTGMSGAGKSAALRYLEDLGFFCADNLPPVLIPQFAEVCSQAKGITKVAVGVDIRGGSLFDGFISVIDGLKIKHKILFLDAKNSILLKRYKESRRSHPLFPGELISYSVEKEKELLTPIKKRAHVILDTSYTLPKQLKEQIYKIFITESIFSNLTVTILSFGFKHGAPTDADMVFDARFIPNPFYIEELREQTGNDKPVQDYVLSHTYAHEFFNKISDLVSFTIPYFVQEDKNQLIVAVGCTGGKHRSVTIANKLYDYMVENGYNVVISHRDVKLPNKHG